MLVLFKTIIKKMLFRLRYLGKKVCFQRGVVLGKKCTFEGANNIGINTVFDGKLGYASYIGSGCCIRADIGRFSSISNNVIVTGGNHPTNRWVSTHPAFYSPNHIIGLSFVDKLLFEEHAKRTAIGNDVWIGDSAIILEGVKIGDGAIVGAGAVVTKDVDPYAIVVGVPARTIKKRFTDDVIERLLQMNWWDKDLNWLQNNAHLFSDYELLLKEERV